MVDCKRSDSNLKWWITLVTLIAVLGLFAPTNVFAIHNSDDITWQLIMISSYPACSGYHYQMTARYSDVTEKYFALYQIPNSSHKPDCMTEQKYADEYEAPDDLDLLILVYDRNKGRADLHPHQIGGIYSHLGKEWTHNHTIIICDCSNFNYSDPVWILSHELSHFILYFLGYDLSVVEEQIHKLDYKYDYCVEVKYDESCNAVKAKVRTDVYSYSWTVMLPYEPAIGQNIFESDTKESILDSTFKTDMMMEVTKWWLEGKILDKDYLQSLEILTGVTDFENRIAGGFASADSANLILTEPPKDANSNTIEYDSVSGLTEKNSVDILEMITYTDEQKRILLSEEPDKQLPQWFKSRALWWVNEKIDGSEFIAGMEYLFKP